MLLDGMTVMRPSPQKSIGQKPAACSCSATLSDSKLSGSQQSDKSSQEGAPHVLDVVIRKVRKKTAHYVLLYDVSLTS